MTSDAERQRLSRERRKNAPLDGGKPWEGLVGEEREQAIRDHFGYSPSEKRSQAERQAVADRIVAKGKEELEAAEEIWRAQAEKAEGSKVAKADLETLRNLTRGNGSL